MTKLASALLTTALALAVAGCGAGDTDPAAQTQPATPSPATATPAASATSAATAQATPPADVEATIAVEGGRVQGGASDIRADAGDTVRLRVTSDASDEIHVHGYDLRVPVGPDQPAVLRFTADLPGVYEVELHDRGLTLAELVVGA